MSIYIKKYQASIQKFSMDGLGGANINQPKEKRQAGDENCCVPVIFFLAAHRC
jgi:hypothetical protein